MLLDLVVVRRLKQLVQHRAVPSPQGGYLEDYLGQQVENLAVESLVSTSFGARMNRRSVLLVSKLPPRRWAIATFGFFAGLVGALGVWLEFRSLGYPLLICGWLLIMGAIFYDRVVSFAENYKD